MKIYALALLLTAGLGAAQAQTLDKHVSFAAKMAPAERLVPALGKAAGVNLTTSQVAGKQVLYLNLHDVSLREAMDRIATATYCDWKREEDGYRLIQTPDLLKKEFNVELAARSADLRAAFAPIPALLEAKSDAASIEQLARQLKEAELNPNRQRDIGYQLGRPANRAPSQRAMLALLSRLNPNDLAMLEEGDRIVYSDQPTRMQRAFGFDTSQIKIRLQEEQATWAEVVAKLPRPDQPTTYMNDPFGQAAELPSAVARVMLIVYRTNSDAPVNVTFHGLDAGNNIISTGSTSVFTLRPWPLESFGLSRLTTNSASRSLSMLRRLPSRPRLRAASVVPPQMRRT